MSTVQDLARQRIALLEQLAANRSVVQNFAREEAVLMDQIRDITAQINLATLEEQKALAAPPAPAGPT